MRRSDVTSAAAVSSQLDSMPRIRLIAAFPATADAASTSALWHSAPFASAPADRRWRSPRRAWSRTRCAPRMAGTRRRSRSCRSPPSGDVIQDRPLAEVGGKALWTKELDALPARRPHRLFGPFDEGCRDDPARTCSSIAAMLRARRHARPADRRRQHRGAAARARGSAPPRRAGPRNCSPGGPTSSPCRSAATSRPGSPSSQRGECRRHLARRGGARPARHRRPARRSICCRRRRRARSASRSSPARDDLRALLAAIDHRPTHAACAPSAPCSRRWAAIAIRRSPRCAEQGRTR